MKSDLRPPRLLLTILALLMASMFLGATPSSASPEQPGDAAGPHSPDSVLVRFKPGTTVAEKANAHAAVQGQVQTEYTLVPGLERLRIPADRVGVQRAVAILSGLPSVEYAEPNYVVRAVETTPNDSYWGNLWGMQNIRAPLAWDTFKGNGSVVVADIDTGIDYNHQDLAANVWTNPGEVGGCPAGSHGYNFVAATCDPMDDVSHGTHTAGTIGAVGNNSQGVVGVNWQVKVMALKFLDSTGSGTYANAIAALDYAVSRGVKVSNNSWGGGPYSQSMYDAIAAAGAAGHLFVAAAGNGDWIGRPINNDATPFYPASFALDNIIAVTAIDRYDAKASFANYGATSVDLGAPGVDIYSTVPGNGYIYKQGTSMATPHVAGAAALLWGLNPSWNYSQVTNRILNTARPISALSGITVTGGTLDLAAAVGPVPTPQPPAAPSNLAATTTSSSQVNLTWADNSADETGFNVERSTDGTNFTQIAAPGANVISYSDTGLTASTTYYYRVRAYNTGGASGYSNTANATTAAALTVPNAPTGLSAIAVSSNQVNVTWTDNSNNETGFKIERSTDGTNFTQAAAPGANVISYSDTGLTASTTYYYRVRAYNDAGDSAYSNTASATTTSGASTVHVGDLDGISASQTANNKWTATVTIKVHTADEGLLSGAAVTGAWSNGAKGTASCTTTADGTCSVIRASIGKSVPSVTFTVSGVSASGYTYAPSANHDPDSDSNGTTIVVSKP